MTVEIVQAIGCFIILPILLTVIFGMLIHYTFKGM